MIGLRIVGAVLTLAATFAWMVLISGCGKLDTRHPPEAPSPSDLAQDLRTSYAANLGNLVQAADHATGWPSATDCDGALWAGEALAAGDAGVQLALAEQAPGEIHRRPKASGECYPATSAATVSRDMLVGYVAGKWAAKDLAALQRLADYGEARAWVMGQGILQDTLFTPDGAGMLARAIKSLSGGADRRPYDLVPMVCLPQLTDSDVHIQTVAILTDGQVEGGVSDLCLGILKANAGAAPGDALLAAALGTYTGDMTAALTLLSDPNYQPPTYVRGAPAYALVHWLYAAHVVLKSYGEVL